MTVSVLQTGHNETNSSVPSFTLSPTGLTVGSTIVVYVGLNSNFSISSVVGSVNGSYTHTGADATDSTGQRTVSTWRRENVSSGSETITVTMDSSHANVGGIWVEVGGVKSTALDVAASGKVQTSPGTGSNAVTSNSATNTSQPALILSASYSESANGPTAGTGYTDNGLVDWGATGPGAQVRIESLRITSTGAQNSTFTATIGTATHLNVMLILDEAMVIKTSEYYYRMLG